MCEIQCLIFELYSNMVGGGQISQNSSIKRFFVQVSSCITTWKGSTLKFLTFIFCNGSAMPYHPFLTSTPGEGVRGSGSGGRMWTGEGVKPRVDVHTEN